MQTTEEVARARAGLNPLDAGDWGSFSINDVSAVLPYFFGGGDLDYAQIPRSRRS